MRTMIRAAVVATSLAASASPALAQSAGAQAEVLFRQGRELMNAGKLAEACAAFDESQRLEPAITTLLNLAGCREKNGQLATAWGLFLDAERQTRGGSDANTQQLHDLAQARASKLEPRVSKLTIVVAAEHRRDGLEVTRGNERVDAVMWNSALPIDGGSYTITARAPGVAPWSTQVTVGVEGDSKTVEVPALGVTAAAGNVERKPAGTAAGSGSGSVTGSGSVSVTGSGSGSGSVTGSGSGSVTGSGPVTGSVSDSDSGHRASLVLPLAFAGGAIVLGGVGVGFELAGESTYNQAKAELTSQMQRNSLYNSANSQRYTAEGFAIAGIASAGVAVWMYLRYRSDEHPPKTAKLQLVPSVGGVTLLGRY